MEKKYFYAILLIFMLGFTAFAQDSKAKETIDGLNIYPNPVSTGRLYVTSKSVQSKEVEIFDVLGKRVMQASVSGRELSIAALTPGVYIIKVKEGEATATRKLIVK